MDCLAGDKTVLVGHCLSLGWQKGSVYVPSPDCQESLKGLENELAFEDMVTRSFRRKLGLFRVIQKDLVPILIHTTDQDVFVSTVRVLVNLTTPVECLLPVQIVSRSQTGQETIRQLQQFVMEAKRAFLDDRATTAIVCSIRKSLHQNQCEKLLSENECSHINDALILLRNILHMPDQMSSHNVCTSLQAYAECQALQNKLVWNLFAQGLDIALLLMINNKRRLFWTLAIVQLIALLFKDQNVGKIQRLLNSISEISDSSEDDNESDTSKTSGAISLSGSSCDSSKDMNSKGTVTPDSGFHRNSSSSSESSPIGWSPCCSSPLDLPQKDTASKCSNTCAQAKKSTKSLKHSQSNIPASKSSDITDNFRNNPESSVESSRISRNFKRSKTACNNLTTENVTGLVTSDLDISDKYYSSEEDLKLCLKTDSSNNEMRSDPPKHKQHKHVQFLTAPNCESDSSNEDDDSKVKLRSHPPVGWKSKGLAEYNYQQCSSSICLNAALESAARKGHNTATKESILEKRRRVCMLADNLAHTPSDEDISGILRDFTLSFLHNGFSDLVVDIKTVVSIENPVVFDKSHFLWLLAYFLRLSSTNSLAYHHISCIVSPDMISYLTFEGVMMCEELELFIHTQQMDVQPLLRRMHLLVTAFRELFNTIEHFCKKSAAKREKTFFHRLRVHLSDMTDVRQLFLLLIRKFNPVFQSKQYLIDVISTNHTLILLLEKVYMDPETSDRMDLPAHIKQFGTSKIMEVYGRALENYKDNSELVNDYIFTMMHHIVGEDTTAQSLFQPLVLKTFSKILESNFETKEIWEDLMNYVLREFMRAAERRPEASVQKLFRLMKMNSEDRDEASTSSFCSSFNISYASSDDQASTQENLLYWWYLQYEHHKDPVGKIQEGLQEQNIARSRRQVLHELLSQGIVNTTVYNALSSKEATLQEEPDNGCSQAELSEWDTIFQLVRQIIMAGHKLQVEWLQRSLLEACFVKAELRRTEMHGVEYPVTYYCHVTNQSMPLVPYNESEEEALRSEVFKNLLYTLGFHMPGNDGKIFPRIPSYWSTDVMYSIAQRLGPSSQQKGLKFKLNELEECIRSKSSSLDEDMDEGIPVFASVTGPSTNFRAHLNKNASNIVNKPNTMTITILEGGSTKGKDYPSATTNTAPLFSSKPDERSNITLPTLSKNPAASVFPNINWMMLASKSKALPFPTP